MSSLPNLAAPSLPFPTLPVPIGELHIVLLHPPAPAPATCSSTTTCTCTTCTTCPPPDHSTLATAPIIPDMAPVIGQVAGGPLQVGTPHSVTESPHTSHLVPGTWNLYPHTSSHTCPQHRGLQMAAGYGGLMTHARYLATKHLIT